MKQKKSNEELQSRREFFKKAAKAALPVVGAVVLASMPSDIFATNTTECNGCSGTCTGSCVGSCTGSCIGGCSGSCSGSCRGKVSSVSSNRSNGRTR